MLAVLEFAAVLVERRKGLYDVCYVFFWYILSFNNRSQLENLAY